MRNAVQRPNNNANLSQLSEKKFIVCPSTKAPQIPFWHQNTFHLALFFIEFGDTKTCCTFSGVELTPKSRKKLIGALSCMHKGPKCIQFLWDPPKRIPFVQKHKESALSAILREKPHFGAFPEAKKGVVKCTMLCRGPIIIQIPPGYQKKKFICRKSAILSVRWKFQFSEGLGGSLKKVLILVQRPQHKSTPDPVAAPKNIPFGTIFI